jgi:hypothetical protein
VALPQFSAEECKQVEPLHFQEQILNADVQIALNEAGLGAGFAEAAAVDLSPETARELADLIRDTTKEMANLDVPEFYQEAHDAFVVFSDVMAAGLADYADAVEAGAEPDAELDALIKDLAAAAPETVGPITELRAACNLPAATVDTKADRELAGLADIAAREQAAAEVPPVARRANEALVTFLSELANAEREFADRVDAGEDPVEVSADLVQEATPIALAADKLIRELLERCSISVGVKSIDAGATSHFSAQECGAIFDWYRETAERLTDVNAALEKLLLILPQIGIALPGYYGAVDLDDRVADGDGDTDDA